MTGQTTSYKRENEKIVVYYCGDPRASPLCTGMFVILPAFRKTLLGLVFRKMQAPDAMLRKPPPVYTQEKRELSQFRNS